ncbi:MAG: nitrogen regulation protein NR(II) [Gammaproteobacteria bacterium]
MDRFLRRDKGMSASPDVSILENLTTAVLLLDEGRRIRYLNPAAEGLLETSMQQLQGEPLERWLRPARQADDCVTLSLRKGHPHCQRELPMVLGNGRRITVDCTVTPLRARNGARTLLVEISQLDRQLRIFREGQLLDQLKANMAVVRGMAHEIKNPLGGLRGAAQLLERELNDPALKEYTQIIVGEADRLHNLTDRLLGPGNMPNSQQLNIHEVLELVRSLLAAEASSGVRVARDYDPSIPEITGDRDRLIQATLNIARNALQAVGDNGVITLRTRVLRQHTIGRARHKLVMRLSILDDGPGISPAIQGRIFYPLVTDREHGTGLGLAIAQLLITQHNGLIECESQPGNTAFHVLIPVEREPTAQREQREPTHA